MAAAIASPCPVLPRRGLHDRAAGLQQAVPFGGLDHPDADPILHGPARVQHLELGQDGRPDASGDRVQPDERRVAHRVQERVEHLHPDPLPVAALRSGPYRATPRGRASACSAVGCPGATADRRASMRVRSTSRGKVPKLSRVGRTVERPEPMDGAGGGVTEAARGESTDRRAGGESLLVADDDPFIARLLEIELRAAGYDVRVASDGVEALEPRPGAEPRPRPGRRDDAQHGRVRAHPPPPPGPPHRHRLDHHADGARSVGRQARRVRDRRRRLHRQAVRHARAAGADPRRAPASRKEMRAQSPLTGLPGNVRIEEEIDGLRGPGDQEFALLYADLDHFKAYNDHYGFMRGDQAIQATAAPHRRGRAGDHRRRRVHRSRRRRRLRGDRADREGDRRAPRPSSSASTRRCRRSTTPTTASAGYIEVANRRGELQRFPLLSISIGVASTEKRAYAHYAEAVAIATEMKSYTKATAGSSWAIDRRHDLIPLQRSRFGQVEALTERHPERRRASPAPRAVSMPSATIAIPISSPNDTSADVSARFGAVAVDAPGEAGVHLHDVGAQAAACVAGSRTPRPHRRSRRGRPCGADPSSAAARTS